MAPIEMTLAEPVRGGGASTSHQESQAGDAGDDLKPKTAGPLRDVVANAIERWFRETWEAAQSGDHRQMALLGEMYAEGYGCQKNLEAAEQWTERAKQGRAVRAGVYCTL
ncbi:hypothetical protein CYMTET_53341 [Cymbomonas tetramitiformis]|uniref:Sel1 repeat family protein n=1 Tax=Cymbomonas tetramitiformis TaxID=36881 RepID=A0AAE0BIX5_9CHLO|nr:hypothetical protein CYMTET_53341 [Cymbomonas tetramitiformis]